MPTSKSLKIHNSTEFKKYLNNIFDAYIPEFEGTLELSVLEKEKLIQELEIYKQNDDFAKLENKIKEIIKNKKKGELNIYSDSISNLTGLDLNQEKLDKNYSSEIEKIEIDTSVFYFWHKQRKYMIGKYFLENSIDEYISLNKKNKKKNLNDLKKLKFLLFKRNLTKAEKEELKYLINLYLAENSHFFTQLSSLELENIENLLIREKLTEVQDKLKNELIKYNRDIEKLRKMKIKIAKDGEKVLKFENNAEVREDIFEKIKGIDLEIIDKGNGIKAILRDSLDNSNLILLGSNLSQKEKIRVQNLLYRGLKGFGIEEKDGKYSLIGHMTCSLTRDKVNLQNDNFWDFAETGLAFIPLNSEIIDFNFSKFRIIGTVNDAIKLINSGSSKSFKIPKKSKNLKVVDILKNVRKSKKSKIYKNLKESIFSLGETKTEFENILYNDEKSKILTFGNLGIAIIDWFGDVDAYLN